MTYTDSKGRTTAVRIAAVHRATPITNEQRDQAEALLSDMLAAAERHGVDLDAFDWTVDLPGACVDVVRARRP